MSEFDNIRPACPSCLKKMELASIATDKRGFSFRTFECLKCEHTEGWIFNLPALALVDGCRRSDNLAEPKLKRLLG